MLNLFFRSKTAKNQFLKQSESIYLQIMGRLEQDVFYQKFGLNRTLETVMQVFFLHLSLVMIILKHKGVDKAYAQTVFDTAFENLENSFLENGASDYSIGHKMKKALKFFYGGLAAYEKAIVTSDMKALEDALRKNIYVKQAVSPDQIVLLTKEVNQMLLTLNAVNWLDENFVCFKDHF